MLKKGILLLILAIIITLFLNRTLLIKLYRLSTLNHPNKIVHNFLNMEKYVDTRAINKSTQPNPFPKRDAGFQLPANFTSRDSLFDTADFLDQTFSTGMLVLHKGNIIMEQYWRGMTDSTTHFSFSLAKSYTSALVGLAIQDGLIESVDDPIVKYLPQFKETGYKNATIKDCLEMSSGIQFNEEYGDPNSDIKRFQKHYVMGKPMKDFLLKIESDKQPGTYNGYNSMDAQVIGFVLDEVLGGRSLSSYLQERIWEPLGMEHDAQWAVDGAGVELTLGGLNVTLRDYAKFGQLYLQKGQWGGQQIIPQNWVRISTTPHAPHLMPGHDNPLSSQPFGYGYFWWIPIEPSGGDFFASGIYNQYIYVNPEKELVIAKTTANYHFPKDPLGWKERYIDLFQAIANSL